MQIFHFIWRRYYETVHNCQTESSKIEINGRKQGWQRSFVVGQNSLQRKNKSNAENKDS